MINLQGKNKYVIPALESAGHSVEGVDGVLISDDDLVVQAFIDAYDPLDEAKAIAINAVKQVASEKAAAVYTFIDPSTEQAIGLYHFASDLYLSTIPASREALSGRLLQFKSIYDAAVAAIADINAMTDWAVADSYDANTDPTWP